MIAINRQRRRNQAIIFEVRQVNNYEVSESLYKLSKIVVIQAKVERHETANIVNREEWSVERPGLLEFGAKDLGVAITGKCDGRGAGVAITGKWCSKRILLICQLAGRM